MVSPSGRDRGMRVHAFRITGIPEERKESIGKGRIAAR
jgi:hypothetical protein